MSELSAKKSIRDLAAEAKRVVDSKSYSIQEKTKRIDDIEVKINGFKSELDQIKRLRKYNFLGDALGSEAEAGIGAGTKGMPHLNFDLDALKDMHEAVISHKSFKGSIFTKDAVSPSAAQPPQLLPGMLTVNVHEPTRIAEFIPTSSTNSPSVEYLRHTGTTGAAAITAPGALKPEVTLATDRVITSVSKLAIFTRITDEDFNDFSEWMSYVQNELVRLITDAENAQLLNGDGTNGSLVGLLKTPGILTRAMGSDTPLDAVEQAFSDLRIGPSKATADFIVASPATFSAIRRSKDSYGRYLLSADPSADQVSQLWGVPVVQTTTIADGTALVANSQAAQLMVRQGMVVQSNYSGDDFQKNLTSIRAEERIALLTPRPTGMVVVTGLPGAAA